MTANDHPVGAASAATVAAKAAPTGLRGKIALVTGASSGIGEAIAIRLARAGATVVLTARDDVRLEEVRRKCLAAGGEAWTFRAEVTDEGQMQALSRAVHERHPSLDILVNNAGVVMAGLLVDVEPADWRRLHEINVMGVVHGCRMFLPRMVERGQGGHVVNMASASGIVGTAGMSTYCATKFALAGLTESLRAEMRRHRIGVSLICPGYVDTPIAGKVRIVGSMATEHRREQIARTFRQRSVTPDAVAECTLKAILRNKALSTVGRDATMARILKRLSPRLLERIVGS